VVLVCDFGIGWSVGGNHYQHDRAEAGIMGLTILLDVRRAIHDCRGADLQFPGKAQSRQYRLRTVSRAADHDAGSNRRRIDAAAGRYFFGIHRAEWSGGCLCGSVPGKETNRKSELEIRLNCHGLGLPTQTPQQIQLTPTRINHRRAQFRFCGGYAGSPCNELNRGCERRRRQPRRLLESRRRVVSGW
jgi:hypothetical protein